MNTAERAEAVKELSAKIKEDPKVFTGQTSTSDIGRIPWWQSNRVLEGFTDSDELSPTQAAMVEKARAKEAADMAAYVEAEKARVKEGQGPRRSPRTRVEILTQQLVAQVKESERVYGHAVLPDSMLREIVGEFWKQGQPITEDALRAYTERVMNEAQGRFAQVNGHRNEGVSVVGGIAS